MKTKFFLSIIYAVVFFPSCKKNNTGPSIPIGMSAKVNGVSWSATTYNASLDSIAYGIVALDIGGHDSSYAYIEFGIHNFGSTAGTFNLGTSDKYALYYIFNSGLSLYAHAISGNLIISKVSGNNIQGTFSFMAIDDKTHDTYSITDGQFNVNTQ